MNEARPLCTNTEVRVHLWITTGTLSLQDFHRKKWAASSQRLIDAIVVYRELAVKSIAALERCELRPYSCGSFPHRVVGDCSGRSRVLYGLGAAEPTRVRAADTLTDYTQTSPRTIRNSIFIA